MVMAHLTLANDNFFQAGFNWVAKIFRNYPTGYLFVRMNFDLLNSMAKYEFQDTAY